MGNISCSSFLGIVQRLRGVIGLTTSKSNGSTAADCVSDSDKTASVTTGMTIHDGVPIMRHSSEAWAMVACLQWATIDDRVLQISDVDDAINKAGWMMDLDKLVTWMKQAELYAKERSPTLASWDSNRIFSLIAFGRDIFERAMAEPEIATYFDSQRQSFGLADILFEKVHQSAIPHHSS